MLTILGFLCGIVLAFRFNVFILLPAMLLSWLLVLVGTAVTARWGLSSALEMALVTTTLQLGYLAGFVFKWRLLAFRRRNRSARPAMAPEGALSEAN